MSTRISSKEILAKLMATENILVEHANIPTAGFDLINRKLLLPNWKNISDDVYTLLISHEVGHALHTPTKEWEDAILKTKDSAMKQVVNIVEDVRIEKMIQAQFPGTVRAFRAGYNELEKSNLFGTKDRKIESYGLLDRLNLHFKIGHYGYAKVPFSDNERVWVDKIASCKSFSDVLRVAKELKQFVEENPESQGENNGQSETHKEVEVSYGVESSDDNTSNTGTPPSDKMYQMSKKTGDDKNENGDSQNAGGESEDDKESKDGSVSNTTSNNTSEETSTSVVFSETQNAFDSALQKLVDKEVSDVKYLNFPEIQLDKLVVPYKTVHEQLTKFYSSYFGHMYGNIQTHVEQFKQSSKSVVNQLANLFEMKKKAKLDTRALTSKTGKLDTNKIYSYRYNDDVFKKLTTIPQGKSHGLIMFIDMSSSMHDNLAGTFEQLLNLVLFCKRVSIPFDVYGFIDTFAARSGLVSHPTKPNDLAFDSSFCLRHYFSSRMTGAEFNVALQNIVCIMKHYSGELYTGLPPQECLNTTPLIPSIMTCVELVKKFRKENGLDIVNTIFLTDGEDTHGLLYTDSSNSMVKNMGQHVYFSKKDATKCYVRDTKTFKQWEVKNYTQDMLNILKEVADVKTIGFHIIRKREANYVINRLSPNSQQMEKQLDSFKNQKFCELSNMPGYDAYYLIPSGNSLNVADDEFTVSVDSSVDWNDEKQAKKAMKTVQKSFNNFMKQRVVSRILLNRFIEHIS